MASRGVNKFIGIGRLGKDPEIRYTPGGDAVASFSIAISETWKDKTSGEQQERTEWVQCVAWRRLAEVIGEYLNKGSKIYVEGSCRLANGRTSKARTATRPRSSSAKCRCSTASRLEVAATNNSNPASRRPTTRVADSRMTRIYHSSHMKRGCLYEQERYSPVL